MFRKTIGTTDLCADWCDGDGRPLTPAERELTREVFGNALDPDPVRIHRRKWWLFQPASITMAPDGHLWFHPLGRDCVDDFALAPLSYQGHFVHEMTHVWQYQCGRNLLLRPPLARYRYLPLKRGKLFRAYGLEQQAEIVREGWMLRRGYRLEGRPSVETYNQLVPFWS